MKMCISPEVISGMLRNNVIVGISSNLPKDAKAIATHYLNDRDVYAIFFESESFPEISEGQEVPDLNPVYVTRIEIADSFWNKVKLLFIKATTSLERENEK